MTRLLTIIALTLVVATAIPGSTRAVEPGEMLKDPKQEARARAISRQLRCLVCQNQSIDDSNAPLAADLRRIVRERITAGDNDSQIIAFVTARYGDFVLLKPPFKAATYLLWFGPPVVLLFALGFIVVRTRRRAAAATPSTTHAALSDAERQRLDALLGAPEEAD